jgi:hypothetical protein
VDAFVLLAARVNVNGVPTGDRDVTEQGGVVLSGMRLDPPAATVESGRTSIAVDAEEALRRNEASLRLALEAGEMGS